MQLMRQGEENRPSPFKEIIVKIDAENAALKQKLEELNRENLNMKTELSEFQKMAQTQKDLLSVAATAKLLGCSRRSVQYYLQTGQLQGLRAGKRGWWRVTKQSLGQFIADSEIYLTPERASFIHALIPRWRLAAAGAGRR